MHTCWTERCFTWLASDWFPEHIVANWTFEMINFDSRYIPNTIGRYATLLCRCHLNINKTKDKSSTFINLYIFIKYEAVLPPLQFIIIVSLCKKQNDSIFILHVKDMLSYKNIKLSWVIQKNFFSLFVYHCWWPCDCSKRSDVTFESFIFEISSSSLTDRMYWTFCTHLYFFSTGFFVQINRI
jgi:hypothetical protein